MPIWAPFWHPNGSQNGFLKAFETATAPRDPLRASKNFKSLNIKPFTASKREALLSMWKQNGKRSPLDPSGFHDGSLLVCCCLLLAAAGVPPIAVQTIGGTLSLLLPCCSLSHPQLEPNWLHLGSKMGVQRAPNSIWTRFPKNAPN